MSDVFGDVDVYLVCLFVSGPMAAIVIAFVSTYCILRCATQSKELIVQTIPENRMGAGAGRASLQHTQQKPSNFDGAMDTDVMFNSGSMRNTTSGSSAMLGVSGSSDDARSNISMTSMGAASHSNLSMHGGHQQTGLGPATALFRDSGQGSISPASPHSHRSSRNRPPLPNNPPPLPGQEVDSGQRAGNNIQYPSFFNTETVTDIYDLAEQSETKPSARDENIYDATS